MLINRRTFLASGLIYPATLSREALATAAHALTIEGLRRWSDRVVVCIPYQSLAEWVTIKGVRRIVTRTRALPSENLIGSDGDAELEVLTLGGTVGELQQKVSGAPVLMLDRPHVLFLNVQNHGTHQVTGMAQGCYPIVERNGVPRLRRSTNLGHLVGRDSRCAVEQLHDAKLGSARNLIRGL